MSADAARQQQMEIMRQSFSGGHGGGGGGGVLGILPQTNVLDGLANLGAPMSGFQSLTEQKSFLDDDFIEWMCGRLNLNTRDPGAIIKLLHLFGFDLKSLKFSSELGGLHDAGHDHGPVGHGGGHGLGGHSALDHSHGGSGISYDH